MRPFEARSEKASLHSLELSSVWPLLREKNGIQPNWTLDLSMVNADWNGPDDTMDIAFEVKHTFNRDYFDEIATYRTLENADEYYTHLMCIRIFFF